VCDRDAGGQAGQRGLDRSRFKKDRKPLQSLTPTHRRARVLAVDDELLVLRVIQRTLAPHHDVVVTATAREALRWIDCGQRFDVILCDLLMPEMTGMDFHARLVRVAPEQALNVVFCTAAAGMRDFDAFLEIVPNGQLRKPFEPATLRGLIRDWMRQ
jgi:CheY-like chemotaxis protein